MTGELLSRLAPHLLVGLSGTSLTARERALLSKYPPAGVILFGRNVSDESQLRSLTADIRAIIPGAGGRSTIVAADHEGGRISVLYRAIGVPPSQMAIGQAGDLSLCKSVYNETARRVSRCGINIFLGPVADINSQTLNPVIGTRSFGDGADAVSLFVGEAVAALRDSGLLTCLKHFPGHGSSASDSHVTLPILGNDLDELRRFDLAPFISGIESGTDAVMTGHIVPGGSELPASLDRKIVTGLLRAECGFEGVVMTDALEMAGVWMIEHGGEDIVAIDRAYAGRERDFSDVLRMALEAGNDLLLFSRPVDRVFEELESCLSGIDENDPFWHGRFMELSAASLGRIRKLYLDALKMHGGVSAGGETDVRDPYREVAEKSITLFSDKQSLLPLSSMENARITFLGHASDFRNEVVGRFIASVKEGLAGGRGRGVSGDQGSGGGYAFNDLERLECCEHPDTGRGTELYALRSAKASTGTREILFLLCRKPLTGDDLVEFTAGAAVVAVCGRPYAAELLAPDKAVLVTYGIYDGAADEIVHRLAHPKTN